MEAELSLLGLHFSSCSFDSYTHVCCLDSTNLFVCIPANFDWWRMPIPIKCQHRFLEDFRGQTVCSITEADRQRVVKRPYNYKKGHLWSLVENIDLDCESIRITMFNGRTCRFGYTEWSAIQRARTLDIVADYPLFDNEIAQSKEGIKFFVELDYVVPVETVSSEKDIPTVYHLMQDALVIHEKLKSIYLCSDHTCMVLVCPLKMKKENVIARGSHLIFTDIIVDSSTGAKLCQELARLTNLNIDSAPYKSTTASLRPAFSRKIGQCLECQNHPILLAECQNCDGTGNVGMGSFYVPRQVITHEGLVREYNGESTSIIPSIPGNFTNPFLEQGC